MCNIMKVKQKTLSKNRKIALLHTMLEARHGDLREQRMIRQGKGLFHVAGMGHEAMAAAALLLEKDDYCFPFYRDRGLCIGRGISTYDLALAFFAKKRSSSGGRQLPAHYSDRSLNVWSHLSPITAHWLPAVGVAWGMRMDKKDAIVLATVGEGGSRQGDFYEAICFAKEKILPIVFVVEDNAVAISTRTETTNALAIHGLPRSDWVEVDGSDVLAVYEAMEVATSKARLGEGPQFVWAKMARLASHSSADDHRNYRSDEELEVISKCDPVICYKKLLIEENVLSQSKLETIEGAIEATVKEDYKRAEKEADPKPGDERENVFGELVIGKTPCLEPGSECRMVDVINQTFREALDTNKDVCFFGEDIEDPLGGVFKLTKGLSTAFPDRVNNSPLAESIVSNLL